MTTRSIAALALVSVATLAAVAHAGSATKKQGGITVTVAADGQADNAGELTSSFKVTASSSNRKDAKAVELVLHLLDDRGDEVATCPSSFDVAALATIKRDLMCETMKDWNQFDLEIVSVGPAQD